MALIVIKIIKDNNTKYIKTSLDSLNPHPPVVLENKNYEIIKSYKRYCEVIKNDRKYGPAIFLTHNLLVVKYEGNTKIYTNLSNISYDDKKLKIVIECDTHGFTARYLTDIYTIPIKKNINKADLDLDMKEVEYFKQGNSKNKSNNKWDFDNQMVVDDAKPIIYLYPEDETTLTVKLGNPEKITCSYPEYKETGWNITAYPDGTLVDNETGRSLYSLYWEGLHTENIEFNDGFCVKGEDTIKFLEEKLAILGLTEREAEEFIVYWLPRLQENKYNLIRFASNEEIERNMPLEFSTEPDTVIRVLMEFKAVKNYIEIPEQKLVTPERTGFVAVEWGGTEIK